MEEINNRLAAVYTKLLNCDLVRGTSDNLHQSIQEFQQLLTMSLPLTQQEYMFRDTINLISDDFAFSDFVHRGSSPHLVLLLSGYAITRHFNIAHLVKIQRLNGNIIQVTPCDNKTESSVPVVPRPDRRAPMNKNQTPRSGPAKKPAQEFMGKAKYNKAGRSAARPGIIPLTDAQYAEILAECSSRSSTTTDITA